MKTKLIFESGEELIIRPEWISGYISLAESLTSFINCVRGQEKFKFSLHDFSSLCWVIKDFFENYNTLTRFFEVNITLMRILDKTVVELKNRPKTEEETRQYREALKRAIIIYRTAADDVTTDDIPVEERRLYNQTYALIAKTYLAEYLERPVDTLTDAETYPEYAKLYDWAYADRAGIYNQYAIPYREGCTRADSLGSSDSSIEEEGAAGGAAADEKTSLLPAGLRQRRSMPADDYPIDPAGKAPRP
jgi:hypothetical protein